jgi:hypothetical protein
LTDDQMNRISVKGDSMMDLVSSGRRLRCRSVLGAAALALCSIAFSVPGGANAQSFFDDFESPTLSSFWATTEENGDVQLSSVQSVSGAQSVSLTATGSGQHNVWISHVFSESTRGTLSARFYDTGPGLYAGLYANDLTNSANDFAVNVADWNASKFIWHGPGVSETPTAVNRTRGWHDLELRITTNGFEALIDDAVVGSVAGNFAFNRVMLLVSGPSGNATFYFDDFSFTPVGLSDPILKTGDLVVADAGLLKIDPVTGAQTPIVSGGGCCGGQRIAFASNGEIFALAGGPARVVRVNPATGTLTTISSGQFFVSPNSIALEANGDILVTDHAAFGGPGGVIRINPATGVQTPVSSDGFFSEPLSLAVAAGGDIFIVDSAAFGGGGGVIRVNPATGIQSAVASGGNFHDPTGIALAANGAILVADPAGVAGQGGGPGRIIRVEPQTGAQSILSSAGLLVDPWGITVATNGDIFVTDPNGFSSGARVIRINPMNGAQSPVSSGGMLVGPTGIAIVPAPSNLPPSVTCPGAVDMGCASVSGSPATLTVHVEDPDGDALTVRWIVDGVEVQTDTVPAGWPPTSADLTLHHTFAVGTHTVEVVVSDGEADAVSCTTTVNVTDTTAPTITAPSNIHAATGTTAMCGVVIDDSVLGSAVASDTCGSVSVTRSGVPAGNIFPVGETVLTHTATDDHGHTAVAFQIITVSDAARPSIACPAALNLSASTSGGATVSFPTPAGADNCAVLSVSANPPSGSTFPIGTTLVTATVTDTSGNMASCSFSVTVQLKGARDIKQDVLDDLIALREDTTRRRDRRLLLQAIQHLAGALQPAHWADANHLRTKSGDRVFKAEKAAVHALRLLQDTNNHKPSDDVLQELIDRLVRADRLLAAAAFDDATSAGGNAKSVAKAKDQLADGDSDAAGDAGNSAEMAIGHYRNAWRFALMAVEEFPHPKESGRDNKMECHNEHRNRRDVEKSQRF